MDTIFKNQINKNKYIWYNIKYAIPCGISSLILITFKPKVGFDFWSITIDQFISVVDLESKHNYKQKTSKILMLSQFNKNSKSKNNNNNNKKHKHIDKSVIFCNVNEW